MSILNKTTNKQYKRITRSSKTSRSRDRPSGCTCLMASPVSSGSKRPADNTDQPSKVVKQLGRSTPLAEIEHNTAGDTANGLFMSTIAAAGFDLWGDSEQHVMKSDVHTFARKCSKVLHHRPEAVLEFRRDFEKYVDDSAQLLKSLRPWRSTGDTTVVYSQQETLIKLLLGIDSLQPSLLDVLLEKLAEHSCGEESRKETSQQKQLYSIVF